MRSRLAWAWVLLGLVGGGAPASAVQLTITQYGTIPASLPWAVALEGGFLKKNGLDVTGIVGSNGGGTTIRNMVAGDLPFAEVATAAAISGLKAGLDLKIVYSAVRNFGEISWVVLKDSPLKTIADLKGHKAGYNNPHSTTEMVLKMVLQKAGLEGQVQLVTTGGQASGVTLMEQHAVDSSQLSDPRLTQTADKYRILFQLNDYIPELVWTVGVATSGFIKEHPDTVRKLILARRQAVDLIYQHPDNAAKIYAKVWEIDGGLAAQLIRKLIGFKFWARGEINRPGLEKQVEGLQLIGNLTGPFDIAAMIDDRFLPDDLK